MTTFHISARLEGFGTTLATVEAATREEAEADWRAPIDAKGWKIQSFTIRSQEEFDEHLRTAQRWNSEDFE